MKDKNNIKTIILSALVTGIITILATLAVNYFSSKKDKLSYTTQSSIPFQNDTSNTKIYNIDLFNDGDGIVEEVNGIIHFDKEYVSDYKVKCASTLSFSDTLENQNFKIQIPSLNPTEKVSISFLVNSLEQTDSLPKISFRAKGLFGKEITEKTKDENVYSFAKIIIPGSAIGIVLSSLLLPLIRKIYRKNADDDDQHADDQNKIIAYLCGVHGLTSEINRYLDLKNDVSYWSEADYFGNLAILNKEDADNKKRLGVLLDLVEYASIAEDSRGIVYYNIAKIYKALNDEEKTIEYINKAKEIIPKRIAKRLLIDKQIL